MVTITDITQQKNKDKLNLFVNGEFYSGINKETAISCNLFVGKKIEQTELDQVLLQSESKQAFSKACDYLGTRLHSKYEIFSKLLKKGFSKPAINMAIKKLEDYGYISDKQFAKNFVEQNTKLSMLQVQNKLISKGIDRQIIDEVSRTIDEDNQQQLANSLALKYAKNKPTDGLNVKLYAHLARKGFTNTVIKNAIKSINLNLQEDM